MFEDTHRHKADKEGGMRAGRAQRSRVTVKKEVKASAREKAPRDRAELKPSRVQALLGWLDCRS